MLSLSDVNYALKQYLSSTIWGDYIMKNRTLVLIIILLGLICIEHLANKEESLLNKLAIATESTAGDEKAQREKELTEGSKAFFRDSNNELIMEVTLRKFLKENQLSNRYYYIFDGKNWRPYPFPVHTLGVLKKVDTTSQKPWMEFGKPFSPKITGGKEPRKYPDSIDAGYKK